MDATSWAELPGMTVLCGVAFVALLWLLKRLGLCDRPVPSITVPPPEASQKNENYDPRKEFPKNVIPCYDPATMEFLGTMPAMTTAEVESAVADAWVAAKEWRSSSFEQRRAFLKILAKFVVENQEPICKVSARDSGKTMVDAAFAEVMCTCEKLWWLVKEGEQILKPERRSAGLIQFYKSPRVEYIPLGVVGAIVPWNYPFHNLLSPITAAVFAGNAIIIKVSEHASWSVKYYSAIVDAALAAAGAPKNLVKYVTGYAEAGKALVSSNIRKLTFVGSTAIGRSVMKAASEKLTPVLLELGGKDPIVVCDDADLDRAIPILLRAAFQSCGANCIGGERLIVQESIYAEFLERFLSTLKQMRQGPPLGPEVVDVGAICMPGLAEKADALVQDAVSKGATVQAGGVMPEGVGQFYPPTVLTGVTRKMRIWQEEAFSPVLVIVPFKDDAHAVELVNDSAFGLGASVFSNDLKRANALGAQLECGMLSINDFSATYVSQSLPFGGVKDSGFDRFGGVEGLRGMCEARAVSEDTYPWFMNTTIPPMLRYPVKPQAFSFIQGLSKVFYSPNLAGQIAGVTSILKCYTSRHGDESKVKLP